MSEKEKERRGKQHVCGVAMNGFSALLSGGNSGRLARSDAPVEQQQQEGNGGGGGGGGFDDFHVKGPSILVFSGERNFAVLGFLFGRGIGLNGSDGQCGFWWNAFEFHEDGGFDDLLPIKGPSLAPPLSWCSEEG